MDRLSRNTPLRWGSHGGMSQHVKIFILCFFAAFVVICALFMVWLVIDPAGGQAALQKLRTSVNSLSAGSEEEEQYGFSYDKFRKDIQLLSRDPVSLRKMADLLSRANGVSPLLVWSVIEVESNFAEDALALAEEGPVQPAPAASTDLQVDNPLDPYQNVRAGVRQLSILLKRYKGNTGLALAAYHAGSRAVEKAGGIPKTGDTQLYVEKVMAKLKAKENTGETKEN